MKQLVLRTLDTKEFLTENLEAVWLSVLVEDNIPIHLQQRLACAVFQALSARAFLQYDFTGTMSEQHMLMGGAFHSTEGVFEHLSECSSSDDF